MNAGDCIISYHSSSALLLLNDVICNHFVVITNLKLIRREKIKGKEELKSDNLLKLKKEFTRNEKKMKLDHSFVMIFEN